MVTSIRSRGRLRGRTSVVAGEGDDHQDGGQMHDRYGRW